MDGHDVQLDFIFEFFILNSEGTKGLKTFVDCSRGGWHAFLMDNDVI